MILGKFLNFIVLYWIDMERMDSLVLFLILVELLWVSLHLIWCRLPACCILVLFCLGMLLVSLISVRLLLWRGFKFCQRLFQYLMRWSCDFFQFVYMVDYIERFLYVWTIPASLGWSLPGQRGWSFWYVFGFSLPVFSWVLHQYLWVKLVCDFCSLLSLCVVLYIKVM